MHGLHCLIELRCTAKIELRCTTKMLCDSAFWVHSMMARGNVLHAVKTSMAPDKIQCLRTAAWQLPFTKCCVHDKAPPQNKRTNRLSPLVWLDFRACSNVTRLPLCANRQRKLVARRGRHRRRRLLTRKKMSRHSTAVNVSETRTATKLNYLSGSHLFLHTAHRLRHAY